LFLFVCFPLDITMSISYDDVFTVDSSSPLWFFKKHEAVLRKKWPDLFEVLDRGFDKIMDDTAWTLYKPVEEDRIDAIKAIRQMPFSCYNIFTSSGYRWNIEINPEWLHLGITVRDLIRVGRLCGLYKSCEQQAQQTTQQALITGEMLDSLLDLEWPASPLPKDIKLTLRRLLGIITGVAFVSPVTEKTTAPFIYCNANCDFFALTHADWIRKHQGSGWWRVHLLVGHEEQQQVRLLLKEVVDYFVGRFNQAFTVNKMMGANGVF
jgi:hypothetical protein